MANQVSNSTPTLYIVSVTRPVIVSLHTDDEYQTAKTGGSPRPTSGWVYPQGDQ